MMGLEPTCTNLTQLALFGDSLPLLITVTPRIRAERVGVEPTRPFQGDTASNRADLPMYQSFHQRKGRELNPQYPFRYARFRGEWACQCPTFPEPWVHHQHEVGRGITQGRQRKVRELNPRRGLGRTDLADQRNKPTVAYLPSFFLNNHSTKQARPNNPLRTRNPKAMIAFGPITVLPHSQTPPVALGV